MAVANAVQNWWNFGLCNENLISNVRMTVVFGSAGNESFFVTDDDKVYGLGTNRYGCLGLGNTEHIKEPQCLKELDEKKICNIVCGLEFVLATTEDGKLYTWGYNSHGEVGNGKTENQLTPQICETFQEVPVKLICCGEYHCLVVTSEHKVFAWGYGGYGAIGKGDYTTQLQPIQIEDPLKDVKVSTIACGNDSSYVVTETGALFSWGYNTFGELGIGNTTKYGVPQKVTALDSVIVTKIRCGSGHVLALTDQGHLFSWGRNNCGQLGNGNKNDTSTPQRIEVDYERFTDVGAYHRSELSVAISETKVVYAWGLLKGQEVLSPTRTNFHSIDDAYVALSTPFVTFRPYLLRERSKTTVNDTLRMHMNNKETSDLTFVIGDHKLYAHKALLKMRSDYMRRYIDAMEKKFEMKDIPITKHSYKVFQAFLQYIYTDNVDLLANDAMDLFALAVEYNDSQLKELCEKIIRNGVSVENVFRLYAGAIKFSANFLEDFCYRFAVDHLTDAVQTDAYMELNDEDNKSFMVKAAIDGAYKK